MGSFASWEGLASVSGRVRRLGLVAWTSDRSTLVLLRTVLNVIGAAWVTFAFASSWSIPGFDAISYWVIEPEHLYRWTESSAVAGPFRYSPVLGQLLDPLGGLPWGWFQALFLAASLLALTVLGGRWALALLLIPNVLGEVYLGNIDLFIALALGFGPAFPAAWVFLLLSKGTPAVVLLWFVARGEWRNLAIVLGGTLVIALPSILTTPGLWADWLRVSTQFAGSGYGASTIPVIPRLILATIVVVIGARRGWRWTIAVGGTLAMPGLEWKTLTAVLAILPLYGLGLRADWDSIRAWGRDARGGRNGRPSRG